MQIYRSGVIRGLGILLAGGLFLAACGRGGPAPGDVTGTSYSVLPARCVEVKSGGAYAIKEDGYEFVLCLNPEEGVSRFERKVGDNGWEETIFIR
ncbi:MAG: hypothetical protein HYT72_04240 [Candidatus Aenigmarchaeota archaeon]|nr:hypothetical protein [Candidatus Aenigmarchaeota archaeon]